MRSKIVLLLLLIPFLTAAQSYRLWYRQPAQKWTDALPVGNGRLGAMVFGGVQQDRIQFNEETLWTGEPRNHHRPDAANYLTEIRQLLQEGKQKEAEALAEKRFMGLKSNEGSREQWLAEITQGKGMVGDPALENFDDSEWKTMPVPSYEGWEAIGFEGLDGAVWFRTTVEIPREFVGKTVILDLNRVRDHDFTYLNGQLVGSQNNLDPRKYTLAPSVLKAGKNTLSILVINYNDKGGIAGYKDTARHIGLYPVGEESARVSLNGNWKYKIQNDEPPAMGKYQADYQPFGDLWLNFRGVDTYTDYQRELDLSTATVSTVFQSGGVRFRRTYFAGQPQQAVVVHLTADKAKSISLDALLKSPHKKFSTRQINENTLGLSVSVRNGALRGEALLHIQVRNGRVRVMDDKISIDAADEVTLWLTAATNFVNYKDVSGNPEVVCRQQLEKIKTKTWAQMHANQDT